MSREFSCLISTIFAFSLVACISPTPKQVLPYKKTWLEKSACMLPCYEGIRVGVTTAADSERLLNASGRATSVHRKSGIQPSEGRLSWFFPGTQNSAEAAFTQNDPQIIYGMWINLPYTFTLAETQFIYGNPSHVHIRVGTSPDVIDGKIPKIYSLDFIYLDRGLLLRSNDPDVFVHPSITPSIQFTGIILFQPSLVGLQKINFSKESLDKNLIPWEGMKSFEEYCKKAYSSSLC